jgi:spore maturation protein CgeB
LKLLLVGIGLSYHVGGFFKNALSQSGINHLIVDEWDFFGSLSTSVSQRIIRKILRKPAAYWKFNREVLNKTFSYKPDILLVTKGAYISPETLAQIRSKSKAILINYATDDPFNPAIRTKDLIEGIPYYHLYACTKRAIMQDIERSGCKSVTYIPFGYDRTVHFPQRDHLQNHFCKYDCDLVFIGGADKDRRILLQNFLQNSDLSLKLYGSYWSKDSTLKKHYYGMAFGAEYRKVLGGTKIALCLVRHDNRDGHVMRTFEIPACGAFMLAERTEEHKCLFSEDNDVVFFSGLEELMDKGKYYKYHIEKRQKIAEHGYIKVTRGANTYLDRLNSILDCVS